MRVTLLPREAAARVITSSIATLSWSSGGTIVILVIPVLIDTLARRGLIEALPVPLVMLVVILGAIAVALWRTTPAVTVGYLLVAGAAALSYEVALLGADPTLLDTERYLVNRPTLALVAIGVSATTALGGVVWCLVGFLVATGVALAAALLTGTAFDPGLGPAMVLLIAVVLQLTLFTIQVRQRRRFPRFDELETATRRRAASADLATRTTAVVHDTVLNDLTIVMNAPDALDQRTRDALLDDLTTLEGGAWMTSVPRGGDLDEGQALIRNELARLASDFRWRGLNVSVTGVTTGVYIFEPAAGEALVGALRAAFENVLAHSGVDTAEVEIVYSDREVTFIVSDQGAGFDPAAVPAQRLGVRNSIVERMEAVGGSARVWSSPGAGTTVMIGVPVREVRDPGAPSTHQREVGHAD